MPNAHDQFLYEYHLDEYTPCLDGPQHPIIHFFVSLPNMFSYGVKALRPPPSWFDIALHILCAPWVLQRGIMRLDNTMPNGGQYHNLDGHYTSKCFLQGGRRGYKEESCNWRHCCQQVRLEGKTLPAKNAGLKDGPNHKHRDRRTCFNHC